MTDEDFTMLTVAEAAQELGLSERSVQDRLQRGIMRGRRVGQRVWLVYRSEVEEWKERGKIRQGRPRKDESTRRPPPSSSETDA